MQEEKNEDHEEKEENGFIAGMRGNEWLFVLLSPAAGVYAIFTEPHTSLSNNAITLIASTVAGLAIWRVLLHFTGGTK